MRAYLKDDIIIRYTADKNATEIGNPPRVGLERLRFNGSGVVDLNDLTELWVGSDYQLHAIEVPGSQLVQMTYADRTRLINDAGTIRLKTDEELEQEGWAKVRYKRDKLLAKTDWTQLPDSPQLDGMVEYRQALRDIPQTQADLNNIEWPRIKGE